MIGSILNIGRAPKDSTGKNKTIRCVTLQIIVVVLSWILLHRLFELQIVDGQKYAENFELRITRTVRDHNTRGTIYDCNGEVLAYSKLVYTVTMIDDGTYASKREHQLALNSVIYTCKLEILNESSIDREDDVYQ